MTRHGPRSRRHRFALLLAAAGALAACSHPAPDAARPNVLIVVVDALRADRLGVNGYPLPTSPAIDELAASGVNFTRAFSNATWTKPAIATLFTSRFPSEHGLVALPGENGQELIADGIAPTLPTLAETFHAAGYSTAALVNQVHLEQELGFGRGFERFEQRRHRNGSTMVRELADWLHGGLAAHPFFVYLHLLDTHWPYDSRLPRPRRRFGSLTIKARVPQRIQDVRQWVADGIDPDDLRALGARYDEEVAVADQAIADLVAALRAEGVFERTILVVTADHGEGFLEHGHLMHGYAPYDEVLRVPLVMHLPPALGLPAGSRSSLVSHVDLGPTLAELAGVRLPPLPRAASYGALLGGTEDPSRQVFAQTDAAWAVRSATHKLILTTDGQREFYDLVADPGERHNLATATTCPDPCPRLLDALHDFRAGLAPPPASTPRRPLTHDEIRELKALGYL
jgi:arylsulfatase A-like enzyme